jgi:hypothetical protein
LGGENTSDVCTVTSAVHRVVVRLGVVEAVVVVADEISAEGDEAFGAKTASQCGMFVVNLCSFVSFGQIRWLTR